MSTKELMFDKALNDYRAFFNLKFYVKEIYQNQRIDDGETFTVGISGDFLVKVIGTTTSQLLETYGDLIEPTWDVRILSHDRRLTSEFAYIDAPFSYNIVTGEVITRYNIYSQYLRFT